MALLCMALAELGVEASVVHRQPGRHRHRHRARQGQDPRGQGRPAPRRARRRGTSPSSRASRACRPTNDVTTFGAAAPTRPRSRSRRRSRPTSARSTPMSPACSPPTHASCRPRAARRVSFEEMLEMAATGGRVLAPALGRVRPQPPCAPPRALELHLGAGHVGHPRRTLRWKPRSSPARHPRHVRGEGHDHRRARPARHRRAALPRAGRRRRERRHDRAEHVDRRARPTSRFTVPKADLGRASVVTAHSSPRSARAA